MAGLKKATGKARDEVESIVSEIEQEEMETWLCRSKDYKRPDESKIALDTFYQMERLTSESPLDFCIRQGWAEYVYQMLVIDFLILNRDRHGANMEVLRSRTGKSYRLAPLFDQGLSLFCSVHEEKELENADPMADRRVQCFVGFGSAVQNLRLIPREYMRVPGTPCRAYNAARRAWNHNIR